jgi:protein TonB
MMSQQADWQSCFERSNRQTSTLQLTSLPFLGCPMSFLRTSAVLFLSCAAISAFGQNAAPVTTPSTTPSGANAAKTPVDLSGFKEHIEEKNKALSNQVSTDKAIVKKNTVILQDAKRIDAENKRLEAERKALEAQNAEFARESQAMQSETTGVTVPSPPPAAPVRVEPVVPAVVPVAPVKVEPPPPAPVDTAEAPMVAPILPARPAPVATVSTPPATSPNVAVSAAPAPAPASIATAQPAVPAKNLQPRPNTPDAGVTIAASGAAPLARPTVSDAPPAARVAVESVSAPIRVSAGVSQGMLLAPIVPVYPTFAVNARVEGAVVMDAVISKDGTIGSVQVLSGPAMLRDAAVQAVKVARYRPYKMNGEPTEVAATIKVVFQLGH